MHILLIHQAFARVDEPGGTRHHEFALEFARQGHRTTVLAGPVSYLTGTVTARATASEPGVRIQRLPALGGWHRSFVARVVAFLTFMLFSFVAGLFTRSIDIVWGTSPPLFQAAGAWAVAWLRRKPFVLEIRDLWPRFAIDVGVLRSPLLIRMSRWLEGFLYRRADLIIVNSPGYIQHVRQLGGSRVEMVPNGVDPRMFDPNVRGDEFRREHGLNGRFVLMYAGAHGLSNDLQIVLEAADLLREDPVSIVLIGDGKEKASLQAAAYKMGLDNVQFLPAAPKQAMAHMLAAADACLAILKPIEAYKLTYPNKVFDYMAAGRPVMLAIDGVVRQLVETAGAGQFVPPGQPQALAQAVRSLLEDESRRRQMGKNGRALVEASFDRRQQASLLASLMQSAIGAGE